MWVVESTQGPQVVEHGWVRVGPAADQKPNLYSVVESHTSQSIVNGWPVSREKKVGGEKRSFEMILENFENKLRTKVMLCTNGISIDY